MSREYAQLNPQGYSPPLEWFQERRQSGSPEPEIQAVNNQSMPQIIRNPMSPPSQAYPNQPMSNQPIPSIAVPDHDMYANESTASLLPPRAGPNRYSSSELDLPTASGASTPPRDNRHTSWSSASLLTPQMTKSRWYSQVSVSEVSLGSYATLKDEGGNRGSMWSMNDQNRPGTIVRLHDRDDVETWKGPFRALYYLAPFLILIDVGLYLAYLGFRLYCNIDVQQVTGVSIGPAWIFFGVEFLITIPYLINNGWAMFALKKRNRPRLRLTGNYDLPTVDVFVTCCSEDNQVVMDTALAACDQDYPMDRFRVIILDDGKSADLEELVYAARKTWPNLLYMSREKKPGVPHHFKAGNLNFGLEQISLLPGGSGEFVGALDADMIPERHWLRALLPHLLNDRKVAMACPPQLFYNTPRSDPLGQSLDFFVHITEPIKDTLGAAWCTGSGYICRRSALDDIGGIPVGGIAEDVATSNLFIGKGWITAYVHEPLQFGTVPEDFSSHLKQRTRWVIGTVQNAINVNFYLWGDEIKQMPTRVRISSFIIGILSFYPILFSLSLFSIPVVLILGRPLVVFNTPEQFRWLIRAAFATVISRRILEFILYIPSGYHTGQRFARFQIWMAPYLAVSLVRAFILPSWLGGATTAFKPTGALGSALNERDADSRKGMLRRLWAIIIQCQAIFHLLFVYFVITGAVIVTYKCIIIEQNFGLYEVLQCLITHAWWPPLTWIFLASSIWTPIAYAINPPTVPDREELLNRDPDTDIAHPREITKKISFGAQAAWFELEYTLTTIYTALCFAATFFLF